MENKAIKYTVNIEGKKPVIIIMNIPMKDGEIVKHTKSIEYSEAKAIADAFNKKGI